MSTACMWYTSARAARTIFRQPGGPGLKVRMKLNNLKSNTHVQQSFIDIIFMRYISLTTLIVSINLLLYHNNIMIIILIAL